MTAQEHIRLAIRQVTTDYGDKAFDINSKLAEALKLMHRTPVEKEPASKKRAAEGAWHHAA